MGRNAVVTKIPPYDVRTSCSVGGGKYSRPATNKEGAEGSPRPGYKSANYHNLYCTVSVKAGVVFEVGPSVAVTVS
jgi:hypothetical protein